MKTKLKWIVLVLLVLLSWVFSGFFLFKLDRELKKTNEILKELTSDVYKENEFISKNYERVYKSTNDELLSIRILKAVYRISEKYQINPYLILAVIQVESGFKPDAVSSKEAIGLMQILPSTGFLVANLLGRADYDLFNVEDNIEIGVAYLKVLLKYTNGDVKKALQFYNAGKLWFIEQAVKYADDVLKVYNSGG